MRPIALLAITALLGGCQYAAYETKVLPLSSQQIADIQATTAYDLKDPDSATFRNVRYLAIERPSGKVDNLVCGEINGKNSFGAYAGYRTFHGQFVAGKFKLNGIGNGENNWIYQAQCPGSVSGLGSS